MNRPTALTHTAVRRFVGGATGSLAAAALGQALPLVVAAVLARILSPPAYGAFLFLYGTASAFAGLAGYSFGLTATQYVARLSPKEPQRAGAVIAQLLNATARVSAAIAVLGVMVCARIEPDNIRAAGGQWAIGVRHPRRSRWLDELGRLKGGWLVDW